MSGKTLGEVPRVSISLSFDASLVAKLRKEKNRSQLVESLILDFYSRRDGEEKKFFMSCKRCGLDMETIPAFFDDNDCCPKCGNVEIGWGPRWVRKEKAPEPQKEKEGI